MYGFMNLDYIEVRRVPYGQSRYCRFGAGAAVLRKIEYQVACALLTRRWPLCGNEVLFFRSITGMTQKQLGARLGYSDVAILKWERNRFRQLAPANEVALRALMAQILGVKLHGTFDALIGDGALPKTLVLDFESSETATPNPPVKVSRGLPFLPAFP